MNELILTSHSTISLCPELSLRGDPSFARVLADLSQDLQGVLACSLSDTSPDVVISFTLEDGFGPEQYSRRIAPGRIHFAASETFGLIWGIYDLCEYVLGVNPFRSFSDLPYISKDQAAVPPIPSSPKPAYRFRGWFFNDEDYITGWREIAGKRPVDYLFYSNIMSHETVEELTDVLLRNRLNLMIPSSFLDIDMPEDEENIRRIAGRGLYVSQHHIEPLGVSHHAFTAYCRRNGLGEGHSYTTAPEVYDQVWRHYVGKWAKYKHVIWQLGLRGKVDRPIWKDDAAISSEEYAGKVISDAIAHQLSIVRQITGQAHPLATVTLWEEGAELYRKGYLKIPQEAIIVFTNWPRTQMMRKDFQTIPREESRKYGVYHHTGSYCAGPHAVQGQKLELMRELFRTTMQKGDTELVISNVQCLRELVYGAYAMAKFAFQGYEPTEASLRTSWCASILPDRAGALSQRYRSFYDTYLQNRWDDDTLEGVTYWFDGYIRQAGLLAMDKYAKNLWHKYFTPEKTAAYVPEMKACSERWEQTARQLESFCAELPMGKARSFLTDNLCVQARIIAILSRWSYLVNDAIALDREGAYLRAARRTQEAANVLEGIYPVLAIAEHDKFVGWYRLEDKFDYPRMLETTREFQNFLQTPPEDRVYRPEPHLTGFDYILNYKFPLGWY